MRVTIEPSIMYFGTPVVLINTLNEDGSTNIAPISSVWWLGWSCMIGLDGTSKSTENLKKYGRCVLNLASGNLADKVNNLALLTGSKDIPVHKKLLGYKYARNKFSDAGFTPQQAGDMKISFIQECQIQLDASVEKVTSFAENDKRLAIPAYAMELKITQVSVSPDILLKGEENKIDPNKWNPLIMNFRKFYSLSSELNESRLAKKSEDLYAPWKRKGISRILTDKVLSRSNKKYGH
ncbi:MAG: flavin reductase family protein [Pseudomonadales bacterium]|nr:flavin reductase family protein [Pseudomonadales bacterium]